MVRDQKEREFAHITRSVDTIVSSSVPNYFDSQRFGSVIDRVIVGKKVELKDYERAVKQYLTAYQKSRSRRIKDEKRRILSSWNDLTSVQVYNKAFNLVIREYLKSKDWLSACRKIPVYLREIDLNAYQSFHLNECVKEIVKNSIEKKKLFSVEYAVGSLLFYTNLSEQEHKRIPKILQTISDEMTFTDDEQLVVNHVLAKEGLWSIDFNIMDKTENFFKTRMRQVLLIPTDFMISKPRKDEIISKSSLEFTKSRCHFQC